MGTRPDELELIYDASTKITVSEEVRFEEEAMPGTISENNNN